MSKLATLPEPRARPQVGATPEGVEKPRCLRDAKLRELAASLAPENAPTIPKEADVKVGVDESGPLDIGMLWLSAAAAVDAAHAAVCSARSGAS